MTLLAELDDLPCHWPGREYATFIYHARALIAEMVAPSKIFEYGALYGYGLVALMHGATSGLLERVGWIDNEAEQAGSNERCLRNVKAAGYWFRDDTDHRAWYGTQRGEAEAFGHAELVSIDGDHSYENCRADLQAAWAFQTPGVIIVDDIGPGHLEVIRAVREFAAEHPPTEFFTVTTQNGLAVLSWREDLALNENLTRCGFNVIGAF